MSNDLDLTLPTMLPDHLRPMEDRLRLFFADLARYGNATRAAKVAALNYAWLISQRKRVPAMRSRWELALAQYADALEAAAYTRAVDGTVKPVYQGGVRVGELQEYSDSLLGKMLEANSKKYARAQRVELANAEGATFKVEQSPTVIARKLAFALALGLQKAGDSPQPTDGAQAVAGEDAAIDMSPYPEDESAPDDGSDLA